MKNTVEETRDLTLAEWVGKLPANHSAKIELELISRELGSRRAHPIKWGLWKVLKMALPWFSWKPPIDPIK